MKPKKTNLNVSAHTPILPKPYTLTPVSRVNVVVNTANPASQLIQIRPNNSDGATNNCFILVAPNQCNQTLTASPSEREVVFLRNTTTTDAAFYRKSRLMRMKQRVVGTSSGANTTKYVAILPNPASNFVVNPSNQENSILFSTPKVCMSNSREFTNFPLTVTQNSAKASKESASTVIQSPSVSGILQVHNSTASISEVEIDSDVEIISPPSSKGGSEATDSSVQLTNLTSLSPTATRVDKRKTANILSKSKSCKRRFKSTSPQSSDYSAANAIISSPISILESQATDSSIELTNLSSSSPAATHDEQSKTANILSKSKSCKRKIASSTPQNLESSVTNAASSQFTEVPVIRTPTLQALSSRSTAFSTSQSESISTNSLFSNTSSPIFITAAPAMNWNENELQKRDIVIEIQKKAIEALQSQMKMKDHKIEVLEKLLKKAKKDLKSTKDKTRRMRKRVDRLENCSAPPLVIDESLRKTFAETKILSELISSQFRRYTPTLTKHFGLNRKKYSNIEREVALKLFDSVGSAGYRNLQEIGMILPVRTSIKNFLELRERAKAKPHIENESATVTTVLTEVSHVYKFQFKTQRLSNGFKQYACRKCAFITSKRAEAQLHVKEHVPLSRVLYCRAPGCDYKTSKKPLLITHMRKHRPKGYVCDACEAAFMTSTSLNLHRKKCKTLMSKMDEDERIHVCPQIKCRFTTFYAATFEAHLKNCPKLDNTAPPLEIEETSSTITPTPTSISE